MINRNLIKKENTQLNKSYLEGWQQSLQNFDQLSGELEQIRRRTKRK
jgi:hypothetical protein